MLLVWHRCCPLAGARLIDAALVAGELLRSVWRGAAPLHRDALLLHTALLSLLKARRCMLRRRVWPVWRPALEMPGLVGELVFSTRVLRDDIDLSIEFPALLRHPLAQFATLGACSLKPGARDRLSQAIEQSNILLSQMKLI